MDRSLFLQKYLERIKFNGDIFNDIYTLKKIQKQHLLTIPFENLNMHCNKKIEFDVEKLWDKIVKNRRGGVCYELNGLLFHLLKQIGFNVKYIGAKVLENGNEFDHVLLYVILNKEIYLVDVGFGDNFLEPLKFITDEVQQDEKGNFKIVKGENNEYKLFRSLTKYGSEYYLEYIFTFKERNLDDFKERCLFFETAPKSIFAKNKICSIETENGRISLKDDKLIITKNDKKVIKRICSDYEFAYHLKLMFNITYN